MAQTVTDGGSPVPNLALQTIIRPALQSVSFSLFYSDGLSILWVC